MAEHTAAQKRFIVLRLAAFDTPRVICDAFRMRFPDTACTEDDVNACHPRVAMLPPGLAEEFYAERRRLLGPDADLAEVAPFAEQKARLIALSQQAEFYAGNNQPAEARAVMRQIAEEQGVMGKGASAVKADEKTPEVREITVKRSIVYPSEQVPVDPANS